MVGWIEYMQQQTAAKSTAFSFQNRPPCHIYAKLLTLLYILTMTLRRNYDESLLLAADTKMAAESSKQEYEALLQFQLKREREKNLILQQRLRNKEVFIQQMKRFQEEVTLAYEKCKDDLVLAQQRVEYLQNVEFREYTEQIADLKHMLYSKNSHQPKRDSLNRDERNTFASLSHRNQKSKNQRRMPSKSSERRDSKTASHMVTLRERSPERLQEQIRRELKKTSNFIIHFLQMVQFYLPELKNQEKLTKKLKRSWKWVKDVVKDWDQQAEKIKVYDKFKAELAQLFNVNNDVEDSILLELIKNTHKSTD